MAPPRKSKTELDYLLDMNWVKRNTEDISNLKVELKKHRVKGTSLYAKEFIPRGNIISYYRMTVFPIDHKGPFGNMYYFYLYDKHGNLIPDKIGDLFHGSLPQPRHRIPFWAYFSNEPNSRQTSNSYIDTNVPGNYKRGNIKIGDQITYHLKASRDIYPGEEIVWCYGEMYNRDYAPNCPL